jgi:hypothetical protein
MNLNVIINGFSKIETRVKLHSSLDQYQCWFCLISCANFQECVMTSAACKLYLHIRQQTTRDVVASTGG